MRKIFFLLNIVCVFTSFTFTKLIAQSLPVGTPGLDDYYRRQQLLGKIDSNVSFTIRPLFPAALKVNDVFDPDSSYRKDSYTKTGPVIFDKGKGLIQILPLNWQQ
ncbi:MAG: hypothetical protein JWP67_2578, partial [Mucilaginibacter sp.]|nr:hypothetical protein [Mucilaginibacter sp.]